MSNDTIKRSDAIKATWQEPTYTDPLNVLTEVRDRIEAIPSADRPQGEWVEVDDVSISCRCSVCGWEAHLYEDDVYGMPYCPNCGADMRGKDNEQTN